MLQLDMTAPRDKLESVCRELDHALRREQRAQQLLREQSQQLNDLGLKVDLHTTQTLEKEATLTDAVQVESLQTNNLLSGSTLV